MNPLDLIKNSLLFDFSAEALRERMLALYVLILNDTTQEQPKRFCVRLKGFPYWLRDGEDGRYIDIPEREIFCIDGFWTESKIYAIKEVRTLDKCGLLEAKTLVDSLQDHAISLDTLSQRRDCV